MKKYTILTINPGSTSTKIGVFENEDLLFEHTVRHNSNIIEKYGTVWDQYTFRKKEIVEILQKNNFDLKKLDAVVGRGGLVRPIPSGIYAVDEEMIQDARIGYQGQHASNLGCVIAYSIGWEFNLPSYIVDPPAVDDFEPLARVSGYAGIERSSLIHALNIFATARNYAKSIKKEFTDLNLIVAHLGGGISVAAIKNGKAINSNNGIDEGPFTPERSGRLPLMKFIKMCKSDKYTEAELKKIVAGKGGLVSYFNTNKAHEVEKMAKSGSPKFKLVYEAMAYQIAEEIGARATNLKGKVDAIILTGGIAHSKMLTNFVKERVEHISKFKVIPGELELEALAAGGIRALNGEELVKKYQSKTQKIGIFYWESIEVYVRAINYVEDKFREKGYIFRKEENDIKFIYANAKSSEENARILLEEFVEQGVEMIFAIGTLSSVLAVQYLQESNIPIICTGLYDKDIVDKRKNIYASCYGVSVREQLENTVLKCCDTKKKLGITYRIDEIQSNTEQDELKEYCKSNKIECVSYDIQDHESYVQAAKFFESEQVDWVFLGSDRIVATASTKQLEPITNKFPTICAFGDTVTHGGLVSYHVSWKEISQYAGDIGLKLLNNMEINDVDNSNRERIIYVNKEKAEKYNIAKKINKLKNFKFV